MQSLVAAALATWPALSLAAPFQADPSASRLVVRAGRSGVLRALSHDHELTPARWAAEVDFDPARPEEVRVDVRIDAATLHDHVARLAPKMRDYVDRETAGPQVLDAGRHPEIRFQASFADARGKGDAIQGVLHGALSLHGATRPLDVPFEARANDPAYRVSGTVRFRQTDYGITPFSSAAGTIGVDDEIQVEFELVLVPASGAPGRAAAGLVRR
ncbi:MAG TPA: YceI family protein [Anaeromyxobacteraceae bacterium]|nr:YceI family protein [Anaeromyxobacteraceae bacterium]